MDLFSSHNSSTVKIFFLLNTRSLLLTVEASKWLLRLFEVKNENLRKHFWQQFQKTIAKKYYLCRPRFQIGGWKVRDGVDLLQIRLCTQISCPLLVAVNFRNSFWSAKNTGRSQEYFLQLKFIHWVNSSAQGSCFHKMTADVSSG